MKWLEKEAVIDHLNDLIEFVISNLHTDVDSNRKFDMEIRLICEEVMTNTINYAYGQETGNIQVGYGWDSSQGMITIVVRDQGIAFDPTKKEDPDITLDIMERQIGGLGIFMVKKLSDSVVYSRETDTNTNQLEIKKTFVQEEDIHEK